MPRAHAAIRTLSRPQTGPPCRLALASKNMPAATTSHTQYHDTLKTHTPRTAQVTAAPTSVTLTRLA
jgi:hypothetical protein